MCRQFADCAGTCRDRRVLPEIGHQSWVGIRRQATTDLPAEPVEVVFVEAMLQVRPGVDAGSGVSLEIDVIGRRAIALAAEEVVETDLVQDRRGSERRQVPPDPISFVIRLDHHHGGVPTHESADATLQILVAGEPCLVLGGDRVDVGGAHRGRHAHVLGAGTFDELRHQEPGPARAFGADDRVERIEPLLGFGGIGVR